MALAYLILAHKYPNQVERLFRAIYRPEDHYVFHFDARSHAAMHQLGARLAAECQNVTILSAQPIIWGGFTAAQVQLDAMKVALQANSQWHHFINLSGQDFPLKPIARLEEHLLSNRESNYVPWFDPLQNRLWANARERIERVYLARHYLDRILRIPGLGRQLRTMLGWENSLPFLPLIRRRPPDFHYYGGSNYVVLSRAAANHAVHDPKAQIISRWLHHSLHPDEIFIQSILLNSEFAETVVNESLHFIDFPRHSPHPKTYGLVDYDRLITSEKFFARKFDGQRDPELLEKLAEQLA